MADEPKKDEKPEPKPAPVDAPAKGSDTDKIAALEARLDKAEGELKAAREGKAKPADKAKDDAGDLPKLSAAEMTALTEEVRALRTEIAELKSGKKGKRGLFEGVFG
jgi:hypothetical protein